MILFIALHDFTRNIPFSLEFCFVATVCQVRDTILPRHLEKNKNPPFPTYFTDGDEELPEDLYADDMFQFGEPVPE